MSLAGRYLEVDFGVANTGLATVGYTLYNAAGGVVVARTTTGVSERGASGVYGVTVPTILDTVASIVWDTGVGSPEYASEDVIAALSANDGSYEDGAVWVDDVDGSDSNSGTEKNPKASVDAAWTVAQAVGLKRLRILLDASYTMTQGFEYATFVGSSPEFATINVGGQDSWGCVFRRCGLGGTWGSGGEWNRAYECEVAALLNIADLTLYDCRIGSTLQVRVGNNVELINCYNETGTQALPGATFDYPAGVTGIFRSVGLSGHVKLTNMSGANAVAALDFNSGSVTVDSTCTDGTVTISGTCALIDNSGVGCTVIDNRTVVDNAAYLETDGPNPHGTGAWDAAAVPPQTIRDAMKLAPTVGAPAAGSVDEHLDDILADTSAMQPTVANNLDATVSSRSSHDAADVDAQLTGTHGAGAWTSGTGLTPQQARDAMKLAPTGGAPAAGSVDEHLDTIEADTAAIEPLATANLDAQVSLVETDVAAAARAATDVGEHNNTQADIAALNNLAQSDILSDATPFPGSNIDAAVTSRQSEANASSRHAADLGQHAATQAAIAALNNPTAAAIADAVLREVVSDHSGVAGSLAELVEFVHDIEGGRWRIDTGADQMVFYKADNITVVATMDLKDLAGNPTSSPSSVTERTRV